MAINHLPPEILREILLRLPIKTLTTARFVNKCWFGFISSSEFVTARLKKSEEDKTFSDHRVVSTVTTSDLLLKQFPIEFGDSSSINLVDFGCSSCFVSFVGSCNGLICVLSLEMRLILLNPCTGEYNELPPLIWEPRRLYNRAISYGFGYDASSDDYKVVFVISPERGVGDEKIYRSVVQVYSLKSNSWRRIDDLCGALFSDFGEFASGKVYWRTDYVTHSYNENKIVWFDVGSEVFGKFELTVDTRCYTRLDVLGGCICLLVPYHGSHAELWVMKEYGAWSKIVTVLYTNVPKILRPCSLLPNGEILFFAEERLFVVYNPNDGSFKFLDKASWHSCYEQPFIYVQSLVSPICTQLRGRKNAKLV